MKGSARKHQISRWPHVQLAGIEKRKSKLPKQWFEERIAALEQEYCSIIANIGEATTTTSLDQLPSLDDALRAASRRNSLPPLRNRDSQHSAVSESECCSQ